MQETLKISVFQFDMVWEDVQANRAKVDQLLQQLPEGVDVVFLPEMFTTGFTMNVSKVAETMDGNTIHWMKERCDKYQVALCGSLIIQENNRFFNRLVFVEPSGKIGHYDKHHLFTMAGEESFFSRGESRLIVLYKGWRICPLVCYDLRFPVWSRNLNDYDLLVYSANWPEPRQEVWNTLLRARAIENQSYVVGCNRVGTDGNKITYSGQSQMIGAKGNVITSAKDYSEGIISAEISFSELVNFRRKFPVLDDADRFIID